MSFLCICLYCVYLFVPCVCRVCVYCVCVCVCVCVWPPLQTHEELIDENLRQTRQHLRKKMNSLISQSTQFMADHFVTWFSTVR